MTDRERFIRDQVARPEWRRRHDPVLVEMIDDLLDLLNSERQQKRP